MIKRHFVLGALLLALLIYSVPALAQQKAAGPEKAAAAPGGTGEAIPNPQIVPYANVKDLFGKGMADRYLVWQITVSNTDEARQFQISNIVGDFDPAQCQAVKDLYAHFNLRDCEAKYNQYFGYPSAYAPAQQSELLGVAGVRQIKSGRATLFRALDFVITMAGALAPFNFIGRDGRSGIGILAGTGVGAIQRMFPDLSAGQLQRLASMSYDGKTIVGPQQSSTFLIFLPSDLIFSKDTWTLYKAERGAAASLELKQLLQLFATATITGSFITATPQVTVRSKLRR